MIAVNNEERLSQMPYFSYTIDKLKASDLQELSSRFSSSVIHYIHKLKIWICIDRKYSEEIDEYLIL